LLAPKPSQPAATQAATGSDESALPVIEPEPTPASPPTTDPAFPFTPPEPAAAAPENAYAAAPSVQPEAELPPIVPLAPLVPGAEAPSPPVPDGELSISGRRRLLEDVPEHPEPAPIVPQAEHQVTLHAAEAIAKQYESHLREQLNQKEKAARKSFLGRHWPKVAVGVVVGGGLIVGLVAFQRIRAEHRGQNLRDVLTVAKKAIAQDTRRSYGAALQNLSR